MAITRRELLKAGTAVVAAAAIPFSLRRSAAAAALDAGDGVQLAWDGVALGALTRAAFAEQVRSGFRVRLGVRRSVPARLVEVRDLGAADGPTECFALRFRTTRRRADLPQGTYVVEHRKLGRFPMFLVPMGLQRSGRYYEAVINRLRA